jgi:uncharacterized protein YifE (UPF0438 family)
MTNKEKTKKDISVAFDFAEKIINEPEILEKISSGSTIQFLDSGTQNRENKEEKRKRKYVRVRNQFELL